MDSNSMLCYGKTQILGKSKKNEGHHKLLFGSTVLHMKFWRQMHLWCMVEKKNTKKKTGGLQTPAVSNSTELTLFYGPTLLFRVIGSGLCTDHCYQWLWLFLLSFIYAHCFWPTSGIFRFLIHILHIPSNSVKIGWHTENQLDQLSGPKFTIYNQ